MEELSRTSALIGEENVQKLKEKKVIVTREGAALIHKKNCKKDP